MKKLLTCSLLLFMLSGCLHDDDKGSADNGGDSNPNNQGELRTGPFKLLLFTKTTGFRHPSIEVAVPVVQEMGVNNGFEVDHTEDANVFNPANLAQYEAVFFLNTTLEVLNEDEQTAFEDYITGGGAFIGVHSAADTEHDWPFYGEVVGAYFMAHPVANQPGNVRIEDAEHPSVAHLSDPWFIPLEEFYSFKSNPRGQVRVITSIDESGYLQEPNTSCDPSGATFPEGFSGKMGDHPLTWCHDKFAGRAWYTAIGHEPYLYHWPEYQQHLLNGILTATRRVEASCEINAKPDDIPEYTPPVLEACENQLMP